MDPISDLLTRIRNANKSKHEKVDVPSSKMKEGLVKVLRDSGFVKNFRVVKDGRQGVMRIYLKYDAEGNSVIQALRRESRPGRRRYLNASEIPTIRTDFGIAVLSTNKGILTGQQAKEQNVGGEYLCSVW